MTAIAALAALPLLSAPASTASTAPSASAPPPGVPATLRWSDEFNGSALDLSRWSNMDGRVMNNVTARASNVSVTGGHLVLRKSDPDTGAFVSSASIDGAGTNARTLAVGEYVEARIQFPAGLPNWDAWWTAGPDWPAAGEIDIAEVLSGELTVNYHGDQSTNYGAPAGDWDGAFHTYGVHRKARAADVYWDGRLVRSFPTYDNGQGQSLLLNVGGGPAIGPAAELKVDYVRLYG